VEEVIVILWRRLDDVPPGREFPWMIGVARNVLNNGRRIHSRRAAMHVRLTARSDMESAEEIVVAHEQLELSLGALSAREREILLLHYWDGLDTTELADALGISRAAAATRLSRATTQLRESFAKNALGDVTENVDRTWSS
jgi:RNA polymerase sigma factor (sigma-70 family)